MSEQPVETRDQRAGRLDVIVRRLGADDWQQTRAARLAALADAPYAFSSTLAKEQAYEDDLWRSRAASGRTFGAFDGATIVGLGTGIPADDVDGRSAQDVPAGSSGLTWQLVGMWVAPSYRGQGVADRLVEAVCDWAGQEGVGTVLLWVTEINERATAFYRRLGFVPTGERQLVRAEEPDHWEQALARRLR
jgi:GNAT superfamily N-acetyltransferase